MTHEEKVQEFTNWVDKGIGIHNEKKDDKSLSTIERNRHSYLYYHMKSVKHKIDTIFNDKELDEEL